MTDDSPLRTGAAPFATITNGRFGVSNLSCCHQALKSEISTPAQSPGSAALCAGDRGAGQSSAFRHGAPSLPHLAIVVDATGDGNSAPQLALVEPNFDAH